MRLLARMTLLLALIGVLPLTRVQAQSVTPTATPFLPPPATGTATPTATVVPSTTSTPLPTQTPYVITATPGSVTATPTATTPQPDAYEPNDSPASAARIAVPGQVEKATFYPAGDVDFYALTIKPSQAGLTLTMATTVEPGLDTTLRLLGPDGVLVAENDDVSPTDAHSQLAVAAVPGEYVLEVANRAHTRPDFKTYRLDVRLIQASAADAPATPPATPEPAGAWDQYGGTNYSWDAAPQIPIGEAITGLTFGCPVWEAARPACAVADFFRVAIKHGSCYTVETQDLAGGTDTNVIVYTDQRDMAAPLTGNDDRTPTDLASLATFCAPYTGEAYVLIGQAGNAPPPPPIRERTYSLLVRLWEPPTPTAAPTEVPAVLPVSGGGSSPAAPAAGLPAGGQPSATVPPPPAPMPEPVRAIPPPLTPTPADELLHGVLLEEVTTSQDAQPTAVPVRALPLSVLACYDANLNQVCDPQSEGIAGLTIYVTQSDSGELLGQAITDQHGRAQLTVRVAESASLTIAAPTFAAVQTVPARSPQTKPIVVKTVANLPALIP